MQEYYKILNLNEDATDEEIEIAYKTLKEQYSKDRFLVGEKGNQAAKNLSRLETAYAEIKEYRKKYGSDKTINFSEVEKSIKEQDYAKAQRLLDDIADRNAEWHYLQSVLFYKKNWINESKKQLEIALKMDPHNTKYLNAYTKLKEKIEYNDKFYQSGNASSNNSNEEQANNRQMGDTGSNDCCTCCATWCCIDSLCTMCCR